MTDLTQFDLTGRTALVTGGNTGIGLGMAKGLARAGAIVAINGRDNDKCGRALDELRALNPNCQAFVYDLDDTSEIESFFLQVSEEMGDVDVLVNNAGIQCRGRADEVEIDDFNRIVRINLTAPYVLSQCFARARIKARQPGSIIMIASLMSEGSRPTTSAYTATKGAIRQLVKAFAVDWAPFDIRVNGIGPGYIETDMTKALVDDPEFTTWVEERTPMSRWGHPSDFEGAVVFLASEAAKFVTGQILYVDGGWLATF